LGTYPTYCSWLTSSNSSLNLPASSPGTSVDNGAPDYPYSVNGGNQQFTCPNFLTYAQAKLANKFPFDVIGSTSWMQSSSTCPSLSYWGETFQLCEINTFVGVVQYPIWFTFLVRSIQGL